MDERSRDVEKGSDEIMLPGFRFHPTDEELVSFYLKRKVQQKPLSIELILQLDIYKFDPWDLPKLTTGEKEWYFYCPRDRKYRNSTRPNRVTGAGFWKATGTDRPIYSSEGSTRCIGLKKSLVFYKGRAAKGTKTDWMMHEYRLPSSLILSSIPPPFKTPTDHDTLPANESWAICRIFKKTNSAARRAMPHSWVSPERACFNSSLQQQLLQEKNSNTVSFPPLDFSSFCKPPTSAEIHTGGFVSPPPFEMQMPAFSPSPASSMNTATSVLFDLPPTVPGDFVQDQQQYCNKKFVVGNLPIDTSTSLRDAVEGYLPLDRIAASLDLPFSGKQTGFFNEWKPSLLLYGSPPYSSEILTSYLTD